MDVDCNIEGKLYSGEISGDDFRIKKEGRVVCYGRVMPTGELAKTFCTVHHLVPTKAVDHVIESLKKAMFQDYGKIRGWE